MRLPSIVLSALLALSATPGAIAQQSAPGSVTDLPTDPGSVLVLRGGQTYELKLGDPIFEGDQIFTRTNGAMRFAIGDCNVGLGGQQSILVKLPEVCTVAPTILAYADIVGGVEIGTGAAGGIGASPVLIGLLASGGAAAAGLGRGKGNNPASP